MPTNTNNTNTVASAMEHNIEKAVTALSYTLHKQRDDINPRAWDLLMSLAREIITVHTQLEAQSSTIADKLENRERQFMTALPGQAFAQLLDALFCDGERPDVEERKFWLEVAEYCDYEQGQHFYNSAVFVTRNIEQTRRNSDNNSNNNGV